MKKSRRNNQKISNATSVTAKRNAKQINKRQIINITHSIATIQIGNATRTRNSRRNKKAKKAQVEQSLVEANIPVIIKNYRYGRYIQTWKGKNLASITIELQAEAERLRQNQFRITELKTAVKAAGLPKSIFCTTVTNYAAYICEGIGSVEDIISQMRRQEEERRARDESHLDSLEEVEADLKYAPRNTDFFDEISSIIGSVEDVISKLRCQEEERRDEDARKLELTAAMEAAGLLNAPRNADYQSYISSGTGSVEDVISQIRMQEEVRRTREARKLELTAAVNAAGIQNPPYNPGYYNYIESATGSVEDVISQIRRQVEVGRTQDARRQELTSKLAAAGLTLRSDSRLCQHYISSATGDADSIVDTMKEMDWFFRCTNYATSRKFYYSNADSDYDTDDDDNDYNGGGEFHVDSERDLALQNWLKKRFKRRLYQSLEHDQDDPSPPPKSLWPTINEKWQTALQTHAVRILAPHLRTYSQTMVPVDEETFVESQVTDWLYQPEGATEAIGMPPSILLSRILGDTVRKLAPYYNTYSFVSESLVISWLEPPEGAIGIPLCTLLHHIMGENWHQDLIARTSAIC
jgi:hypothetical protein